MKETDIPDFFTDAGIVHDPAGYFNTLRAKCPVMREPHHGSVMVTGYDEAIDVLNRKGGVFSAAVSVAGPIPPLPFTPEGDDIREQLDTHREDLPWADHIISFDDEKHAAHRALITSLLTYKRLKENEEYLGGLADRLIDRFIARGRCEVMSEYAHAASTLAIADLLGVPEEDRDDLMELLGAPPTRIDGDPAHKIGPDPLSFLESRFVGYIRKRQETPGTDLMSELAQSRFRDGSAPDVATLARLARFVFGAGQDTSARLITAAVRALGEDPALQQRLRDDPDRIPDFIEETLRFDAPTKVNFRLAQTSTTIGDVAVPAGTVVTIGLLAANYDPAHFENPEAFDIDRPRVRDHLTFSRGAHACPGAPLARLETRVAIARLLDRLADIRISEAHHGPADARRYDYEPTYMLRSLSALHIAFTPNQAPVVDLPAEAEVGVA
jgi:cytochrome P450